MKVKLSVLFLLLATALALHAAEPADSLAEAKPKKLSLLRRIIRGFDRLDTAYIEPQHYIYTVMLQSTFTYDRYRLSGTGHDAQSITFAPDMRAKLGPYVGWKWVFLGYTFDLRNISLKNNKQEFDLSIYSSQVGVDLFYRNTGSDYKLRDAHLGANADVSRLQDVSFDGLKASVKGFNLYYVFNHGRFSYPAAFAQSTLQKISCGSWLAGIGYTRNSLDFDHERLQQLIDREMGPQTVKLDSGMMFRSIQYKDFSLSAGYAYNFVLPHHWVIGACLQGAVGYKESAGSSVAGPFDDFRFENLNIDGIGRLGVVYNNMRWYAGLNVVVHTYNYHKSRFSTNNTFGSMNLYVGYNFGLKKKYRKEMK
jgi:hypothetical protein